MKSARVLLSVEKTILEVRGGKERENFVDLLNISRYESSGRYRVHLRVKKNLSEDDVSEVLKVLKCRKATGQDEIKREMLNILYIVDILRLTHVSCVTWTSRKTSKQW